MQEQIGDLMCRGQSTIAGWFSKFEDAGTLKRKGRKKLHHRFGEEWRAWVVDLYKKNPLLHLNKAVVKRNEYWGQSNTPMTIWRNFFGAGLRWNQGLHAQLQPRVQAYYQVASDQDRREIMESFWDSNNESLLAHCGYRVTRRFNVSASQEDVMYMDAGGKTTSSMLKPYSPETVERLLECLDLNKEAFGNDEHVGNLGG
ncbi:hypothetical protein BC828DRAFT_433322 [Blastocladiella britannica]|nr:hypothetical protein BC828DRAFT_433322 [Blastocladiella britannica]